MEKMDESQEELIHDIMILCGRLYLEDTDTFSPETKAVVKKWNPEFKKFIEKEL